MGDSRFGRQEQHPRSFLSGESIPSLLRLPDPASVPIPTFYDAATAVGRGLESFLAASVVDIYCHRERGSTLHEYLLIRFHLGDCDAWARVDRAPVHGTKYISVQSPMARDTIKLSDNKNTLQKGDQDALIEHRIFQAPQLPLFHLLHLLKIIHLEQPKYRLFSTNCWWLARMVRQTLGHHYGQVPYSPKQHPLNVFLKILGKDVTKHTEKIIRQYGDFLLQYRLQLSQPAFHFPYAPAYHHLPFYVPTTHPPVSTPRQMNPPIYPSLHSSYQANIPPYGWPTSPWPSTHPFAGAYFGSSPMWMNPPYLNSRINEAPDTATGVPEVVPPSYPSGRSREEQIEKNDNAVQTTATDALTGIPVVPVPSDLPASHENEKGRDSDNPPNGRRRRRRRNNRNRPTTPSNSRPITPSADHGPRGQDLSAIAATRKRVRGSRPATRPPLASGRSPSRNVQTIQQGVAQPPPSSTFNSRTPRPRSSRTTPRSLPRVASKPDGP